MDLECLSFERREAALLFSSVPFSVVWLSVFPGYRILCIPGSYAAGCALVVALLKASCWSCHLLITGFCLPTVLTQLEVFHSTVKSPQHTRCNYCRAHQAISFYIPVFTPPHASVVFLCAWIFYCYFPCYFPFSFW